QRYVHGGAGSDAADHGAQVLLIADSLAVYIRNNVVGMDPGFGGRAVLIRLVLYVRAAAYAIRGRKLGGDGPGHDSQEAIGHATLLLELADDVLGDIDGDCEPYSHTAAGIRLDSRIDADDLAVHVHQRSAGVAGVDGRVALD